MKPLYTLYGYNGLYNNCVIVKVRASTEEEAQKKAEGLVNRDFFIVKKVQETE